MSKFRKRVMKALDEAGEGADGMEIVLEEMRRFNIDKFFNQALVDSRAAGDKIPFHHNN